MRPLSQDLRERVITAIEVGDESQPEIAERFGISLSTLEKWWARYTKTNSVAALPHGGGNTRKLQACDDFIRATVAKQPDIDLRELRELVLTKKNVTASNSMMSRTLKLLHLPIKKKQSMITSRIRLAYNNCAMPLK
jgi:transposase